jgi:hypothetical protein
MPGCNASSRPAIETIEATGTALALTPSLLISGEKGEKSWRRDGVESGDFAT